ncbi:hypothetical protein F4778DRAFT_777862 [Xylariomycetidae sp. FL2044]|nr:hypothetical protein F4778DRAFT_777862 [Xylariomycetidae sp. FL2044]
MNSLEVMSRKLRVEYKKAQGGIQEDASAGGAGSDRPREASFWAYAPTIAVYLDGTWARGQKTLPRLVKSHPYQAAAAHQHQQQQLDLTAASILASSVQNPNDQQHPDLAGPMDDGDIGPHSTESFAKQSVFI